MHGLIYMASYSFPAPALSSKGPTDNWSQPLYERVVQGLGTFPLLNSHSSAEGKQHNENIFFELILWGRLFCTEVEGQTNHFEDLL